MLLDSTAERLRNLVLMVLGVARVELQRLNALVGEADAVEGLPDELALVNKHTLTLINDVLLLGRDDAELQLRLGALLLRDGLHLLRLEVMLRTNGLLRQLLLLCRSSRGSLRLIALEHDILLSRRLLFDTLNLGWHGFCLRSFVIHRLVSILGVFLVHLL